MFSPYIHSAALHLQFMACLPPGLQLNKVASCAALASCASEGRGSESKIRHCRHLRLHRSTSAAHARTKRRWTVEMVCPGPQIQSLQSQSLL